MTKGVPSFDLILVFRYIISNNFFLQILLLVKLNDKIFDDAFQCTERTCAALDWFINIIGWAKQKVNVYFPVFRRKEKGQKMFSVWLTTSKLLLPRPVCIYLKCISCEDNKIFMVQFSALNGRGLHWIDLEIEKMSRTENKYVISQCLGERAGNVLCLAHNRFWFFLYI